ncbi:SDR family oxidoreductase [Glycomyces scopariae]|uniref:NADP-dependent 3-hydroxy acid dehydrogenase YdfG n=1 Tax=Glycomyces sambucus TaxID=380244 RepID=A0A1G9D2K5_9ACTN|nr:SDR family oxidoreductase [Glycomyces sambucus]SDK58151.1 NADP-dependent 3-hydroxy acid dehydrogenase YdfG [Glycomyces sambucus]
MTTEATRTAVVTGASAGLGEALAERLAAGGWNLVLTARGEERLAKTAARLGAAYLAGDIAYDAAHRERLIALAGGKVDLLVNNASTLGELPLPTLAEADLEAWPEVFETNMRAPIHLVQLALPSLRERGGAVVNISSDAATGPYATWGPYGASKAALDQLSNVLAAEEPAVRVWAVDPGEMRTKMLADAVGEADAAEAGDPADAAAAIVRLVEARPESGRYEAKAFAEGRSEKGTRE